MLNKLKQQQRGSSSPKRMSYLHPPAAKYINNDEQTWTKGRSYLREVVPDPERNDDPLSDIETLQNDYELNL